METAGSRDRVMGQRGPCDRGQGNKCLGDGYRSQHSGILVTNVKGVQVRDCYWDNRSQGDRVTIGRVR